jgi:hypothetical protein
MWPHWLRTAIEDAVRATELKSRIRNLGPAPTRSPECAELLDQELRASMGAISAAAFAIDAFYAAVQARSPQLGLESTWRKNRTARHKQITETLRRHLGLRAKLVAEMRDALEQLFSYRDWAVHPGSVYAEPVYREDLGVAVDWHYAAFRSDNAATAVRATIVLVWRLVGALEQGSPELAERSPGARRAMNDVLRHVPDYLLQAGVEYFEDPESAGGQSQPGPP